jgi:subtilisin family serine protease
MEGTDMASRWTLLLAASVLAMVSPMYRTSAQGQEATRAAVLAETGATFVTFEQEHVPLDFPEAVAREGGQIIFNLPGIGVSVVAGLPETSVRRLAGEHGVADVAPDVWIPLTPGATAGLAPTASMISEPLLEAQWGLRLIEAQRAIEAGFTGRGARIAVIDTGVFYDHPDLAANYAGGINLFAPFCTADPSAPPSACDPAVPDDTNGHGTWVAGIAAAALNGQGIVGVAPDAQLVAIKACGFAFPGNCPLSSVLAGISYAADIGADVINLSINCVIGVTCPEEKACSRRCGVQRTTPAGKVRSLSASRRTTGWIWMPAVCSSPSENSITSLSCLRSAPRQSRPRFSASRTRISDGSWTWRPRVGARRRRG